MDLSKLLAHFLLVLGHHCLTVSLACLQFALQNLSNVLLLNIVEFSDVDSGWLYPDSGQLNHQNDFNPSFKIRW